MTVEAISALEVDAVVTGGAQSNEVRSVVCASFGKRLDVVYLLHGYSLPFLIAELAQRV